MKLLSWLLPVLLTFGSAGAHAWWNEQWASRKQVLIDASITGADTREALVDVPVLLKLHSGNFGYFADLSPGGNDIRFLSGDVTPLKFHVEKLDTVSGIALIWVKLPRIDPGLTNDGVWLYYGNAGAPAAADAAGTYDANQALVYHFGEGDAAPRDATAYGNHAQESSAVILTDGWLGAAAQFNGDGRIRVQSSPSLAVDPLKGWTFSAWVRLDGPQNDARILESSDGTQTLDLLVQGTELTARINATRSEAISLQPGKWQHVALTLGSDTLTLYLDGEVATQVQAPLSAFTPGISIGGGELGGNLSGALDEVGIATVARSADWIKFQSRSQSPDFIVSEFGADQAKSEGAAEGAHAGHFAVIFQTVFGSKDAIVEQVVIIMLGLMLAIAVLVMVLKFSYLSGAARTSAKFLRAFEGLGLAEGEGKEVKPLDALYGQKRFRRSPLYHVYCQGIEEVRKRMAPSVGAQGAGLDGKAINTIRAAMDAVMVRQGQKLNAQMVLLTIAISGGPFIGLLGTVVGVMVTFAAIAASGDVNITAIAPGMAAALLATTAGLGVAIPALFGYNYLGSRAKEISADMHVFADEFLARINEAYGE